MKRELKQIYPRLKEAEDRMLIDLKFSSAPKEKLYQHYLAEYKKICEWANREKNFKFIVINKRYFEQNFYYLNGSPFKRLKNIRYWIQGRVFTRKFWKFGRI